MLYREDFKHYHKDGIKYTGSFTFEDCHPSELFDDTVDNIDEIVRKIDDGTYYWIIIKLEASIDGVILGSSTLGGVLIENLSELDEYLPDMEDDCMNEVVGWLERNKTLLDSIV
jgi:hypothetical protein